jgi:transglutaminase-like putative cysteine protease
MLNRRGIVLAGVAAATLIACPQARAETPTARAERSPSRAATSPRPQASGETRVFGPSDEPARVRPAKSAITYWKVTIGMEVAPTASPAHVQMLLPLSDGRQAILTRRVRPSAFRFREESVGPNLWGHWDANSVKRGKGDLGYSVTARTTDLWMEVPRIAMAANPPAPSGKADLAATDTVQARAPAIARRARTLTQGAARVDEVAWSLYQYVASLLRSEGTPPGPSDALGVLAAERGSGTGKARLLAALLRSVGIPARLVGGVRLEDASRKRATISWVEAWLGGAWVPFDPGGGNYAHLPANYLALYYGDLPLIEHTARLGFDYDVLIHQVTRRSLLDEDADLPAATARTPRADVAAGPEGATRADSWESERVKTFAVYAERPVASVVLITDHEVSEGVVEQIVEDARRRSINVVFLNARFESRYFRENYLQRLIAKHFDAVAESHLLLVSTRDEAGLYALLQLGEQRVALRDARIVISGDFPRPVGRVLGSVLYKLVDPGELVVVTPEAPLRSLWEMARANLLDGVPMAEAAALWDIRPLVIDADDVRQLARWRRALVLAWSKAVVAQVPLQAINLILVLPVIACIVVIFRSVIGIETFGTFAPVIVSLAFLMTGLAWGLVIFAVIVGLGVVLRAALQWFRIQLVARLAVLIALVSAMMAGLTVFGAYLGVGALLNVSIFPMVIMSNVIENFTTTQVESGTREALRLTLNTVLVCAACYLTIEWAGLQSIVLSFPELLVGVVALEVLIGKWRGLRLLEYPRFYDLVRREKAVP